MKSPESREPKITREFPSPEGLGEEFEKSREGEPVNIYARDQYPELTRREQEFSEITGTPETALFNAGMAAIHTAIEAEGLRPGDVVLCGRDTYSQTKKLFADLKARGVEIVAVDSGDMDEIEREIKKRKPRLIVLETVANSKEMQVNDVGRLVELTEQANEEYEENLSPDKLLGKYLSQREKYDELPEELREEILDRVEEFRTGNNPFIFRDTVRRIEENTGLSRKESIREVSRIVKFLVANSRERLSLIVDNTLSSPVIHNPLDDLGGHNVEMVVVESATKHYQEGQDRITMGIAYSNDPEKMKAIKQKRTEIGTYLQPTAEREIPQDITERMPEIVKQHAKNALALATLLSGSRDVLEVGHPNLPQHKQNELAEQIAPDGLVTLFYLRVPNAEAFVRRVKELAGDRVGIGASFGHSRTWLANIGEQDVRIAAGSETGEELEELMGVFREAIE